MRLTPHQCRKFLDPKRIPLSIRDTAKNAAAPLTLITALLLLFCSSETDEFTIQQNVDTVPKDSSRISDTTSTPPQKPTSLMKLKRKIISKGKNPVLLSARTNSHFNFEKWLRSDYKIFKKPYSRKISEYDKIIKKMSRRYGFDWRLIAAQIYVESNFQNKARSGVGASGLMQIMPRTAKFMGYDPGTLNNPEINIAVGCMYNQRMYSLWGKQAKDYNRLAFSLASYNAGRGRVLKSYSTKDNHLTWESVHPHLPEETQNYVHKIYLKHDFYKKRLLP